jgi:hypothetical protein
VLSLIGWLFFRLGNVDPSIDAVALGMQWFQRLFHAPGHFWCWQPVLLLGALGMAFQYYERPLHVYSTWAESARGRFAQVLLPLCCLFLIATLGVFDGATFIYFQF